MSSSKISKFEITGLFNQFDVSLPLENPVNIFLGENGMGKTTVLNCLYFVLSGKLEKLNSVIFDTIKLCFDNDEENCLSISHNDIVSYVDEYVYETPYRRRRIRMENVFTEKELEELRKSINEDNFNYQKYFFKLSDIYGLPLPIAERELRHFIISYVNNDKNGNYSNVLNFKKTIEEKIKEEVLYFPTYRRIEEDISKLGLDIEKDNVKNKLIQFGMSDVDDVINTILNTIRSAAITGFTQMTGLLLKQYLQGNLKLEKDYKIDKEKFNIALDRIGDEIEPADKQKIKELVNTNMIYDDQNVYLLNLIKNLINSYEKQHTYDERVKKFVNVCNKYLNGKKYIYDESNVALGIYKDNNKNPISIQNLSSGEKQVISVFSKLYLEKQEQCIILFDEPELSLSIKWQSQFLPDIMNSDRCSTLIAVTHSPFIFDNEFDKYAKDMENNMKESSKE